jgi:hypothetical protein
LQTAVPVPRPDVAAAYPGVPDSLVCGFSASIGLLGLPEQFTLTVQAKADDKTYPLAEVHVQLSPPRPAYRPRLRPLMLTSLFRSGTTWMMRLLAEHPKIVACRLYPYEVMPARYWMHVLKVLTEPANHSESLLPGAFATGLWWGNQQPYALPSPAACPVVREWFGRRYAEQVASFCMSNIDSIYGRIALSQNQDAPVYFAEKLHPDHAANLLSQLYVGAREIILVRDLRDVLCSVHAFNGKRGTVEFGRDLARDDHEYLIQLRDAGLALKERWQARREHAHLVRYEDLIARPVETLKSILHYLNLMPAEEASAMLDRAAEDNPNLKSHRTSTSPKASLGRWRTDLDRPMQSACNQAFEEFLGEFAYT